MKKETSDRTSPQSGRSDSARDQVDSGMKSVAAAADKAKQEAKDVLQKGMETVQQKSRESVESVKHEAESAAGKAKDNAAERSHVFASVMKNAADALDDQGQTQMGALARAAAERIDRMAEDVRSRSVAELVHDVEDFARRNPAVVIGGAALAGFAISRFLKSSSPERQTGSPTVEAGNAPYSGASTGTAPYTSAAGAPNARSGQQ